MRCAACNYKDTKVVDSRLSQASMSIRRRRECLKCRFRFSTVEEVEILDLTVIKRDGRREAYMREKLESGLRKALQKRPITVERFKELVNMIERDLQRRRKNEITTQEVGAIVMHRLQAVDKVAYIRFASVYRKFEDVETFQQELAELARLAVSNERRSRPKHGRAESARPKTRKKKRT